MAGAVTVRDGLFWSAPTWIHDGVLQRMAAVVQPIDPELSAQLLEARVEVRGWGEGDFSGLSQTSFRRLVAGACRALDDVFAEGPASFARPDLWPAFMWHFSELKGMLREDHRSGQPPGLIGRVVARDIGAWVAPEWLFDMVLEQLAAEVFQGTGSHAASLLEARGCRGNGVWRLVGLGRERLSAIVSAADQLGAHYAREHRHVAAVDPDSARATFIARVDEAYTALAAILRAEWRRSATSE